MCGGNVLLKIWRLSRAEWGFSGSGMDGIIGVKTVMFDIAMIGGCNVWNGVL